MAGTAPQIYRIVTLSSGASRGSNLLAIHRYFAEHALPVRIHHAIFTSGKAEALAMCHNLGIAQAVISAQDMRLFEARVLDILRSEEIALVALCGFMKLLSKDFIAAAGIPILNIHPALLPKYGGKGMHGMNVHQAVFEAKEQVSGATVHRVDPLYDHGDILKQAEVDISSCRSAQEIATKVLAQEHLIYAPSIYAELCKA
jgi:folate-dependent phosphoribosylglycinamide formyltransferase PurN